MYIRVYDYQDGVRKLGPNTRFALWVQGCGRNCRGCMTPQSQDIDGGKEMETRDLAALILRSGREEITISGGEPFLQAAGLSELIGLLRAQRDIGIIVYTGFTIEEIREKNDPDMNRFLDQIDLLIDGPYIEEKNDGRNLRGSSNQRAIALTERYEKNVPDYGSRKAEIELFVKEDKFVLVGVPDEKTLARFQHAFEEAT